MIPELAVWIITAAVVIIALPTLLAILFYIFAGAVLGLITLYRTVKGKVRG